VPTKAPTKAPTLPTTAPTSAPTVVPTPAPHKHTIAEAAFRFKTGHEHYINGRIAKSLPHYQHSFEAFQHLLGNDHVVTKGLLTRLNIVKQSAKVAAQSDDAVANWHKSQGGKYPYDENWHNGTHPGPHQ
jgi:hypothetical protein